MGVVDEPARPGPPAGLRPARPRRVLARRLRRRRRLRADLVQLAAALIAVALGVGVPGIPFGSELPTGRATQMLIGVGGSTIAFIGIVYSMLFLVVQFSSTTFTPRLTLFRDAPIVWRSFALSTAVVVYSFTAVVVIGGDERTSGLVPIVGFAGAIASILVYRQLQTGAFRSIQLSSILGQVSRRGREVIDGLYAVAPAGAPATAAAPPEAAPGAAWRELRWARRSAVLQVIDVPRALRAAQAADAVVAFTVGAGERLRDGEVFARVAGGDGRLEHELVRSLSVGEDRTFEQDPLLAFRVLADIALRALSPAVNDPTTAVQALDAIDELLRRVAACDLAIRDVEDAAGATRVVLTVPSWEDFVSVALDELVALRDTSPAVRRRLVRLVDELEQVAPPARRAALAQRRPPEGGMAGATAPA